MYRKLVGAALLLFVVSIVVLILRDNCSLDDWTTNKGDDEDSSGNSGTES